MDNTQYKYMAFISYRHNAADDKVKPDESWAKKIQEALEAYRLPNAVFKNIYKTENRILPKRLYPIFRDSSDLGVGALKETLEQNLTDSKFLIVICTPRTTQPNVDGKLWVDEEVKYFADALGRRDRIIPILVSGTPSESFVPSLKIHDCLALDVGKFSQDRIINDVVAKILGLNPNELWNRELRRLRRQRVRRSLIGVAVAVLCTFCGWYAYDWQREKKVYFRDYVDCFGVPTGMYQIPPEKIEGRGQAYRFHYQGYDSIIPWKRKAILRKAYCVNSFDHIRNEGWTLPQHAPPAGRLFFYGEDFALSKVIHLEIDGSTNAVYTYFGRHASVVDVIRRGKDGRLGTSLESFGVLKKNPDAIRRYRVTRDGKGHPIRIEGFRDAAGIAAVDANGVHRTDYVLDGLGRVVCESYFSWNGEKALRDKDEMRAFKYDAHGNLVEVRHLTDGEVTFVESHAYDGFDNLKEFKKIVFSADGQVSTNVWFRYENDANGMRCQADQCDSDGNLIQKDSARCVWINRFVDGRLQERDESYANASGAPGMRGVLSRQVVRYDENMRCIESVKYGKDGKLLKAGAGAARICEKYDEMGRRVERVTFDDDGNLWPNKNGIARKTYEYRLGDGETLLVTTRFYGAGNTPICTKELGASREEMLFDKNGRVIRVRIFDINDRPAVGKKKWHKVTFKYNRFGFVSEIAYWGIENERVLACGFGATDQNVAIQRYEVNAAGEIVEESLYDVDEKLMVGNQGWASARRAFDGKGRLVEVLLFGKDGQWVAPREGINCRTQYEYNDAGVKVRQRAYKLDGGYLETEYNDKGHEVANREFNPDSSPRADKDGVHAIVYKRDTKGREIKRGYLDIRGNHTLCEDRYAAVETCYDDHGSVCEEVRYGVDGEFVNDRNGVCIVRWLFDEEHRDAGRSFFDTHTNLVENKDGVAGIRKAYDAHGNKTEEYSINGRGKAIPDKNGVSVCHSQFDDLRRIIKKTFLDAERKPVRSAEGIAGWLSTYKGDTHFEASRSFIDENGNPCVGNAGQAGWLREYDDKGRIAKEVNVDVNGQPVVCSDGTAGCERKYDERGRQIYEAWIGKDGKPCSKKMSLAPVFGEPVNCRSIACGYDHLGGKTFVATLAENYRGVAKLKLTFDSAGNVIEVSFLGRDDALTKTDFGFSRVVSQYNGYRDLTSRTWFDEHNELLSPGCAKMVNSFTRTNRGMTEIHNFYDAQGFPTHNEEGVAYAKFVYDSAYRLIEQEFYDDKHNPCEGKKSIYAKLKIRRDGIGRIVELSGVNAAGRGAWGDYGDRGSVSKIVVGYRSNGRVDLSFYNLDGVEIKKTETSLDDVNQFMQHVNSRYEPQK